jgi:hypothetical protein
MLTLLAAWLLAAGPMVEWDGQAAVQIAVGQQLLLHVPGCCTRFTASGSDPFDLTLEGPDVLRLTGMEAGKGRVVGWRGDGTRVVIPLEIHGAGPVQSKAQEPDEPPSQSSEEKGDLPAPESDLFLKASLDKDRLRVGEKGVLSLWLYSRVEVKSVENLVTPDVGKCSSTVLEKPRPLTHELKILGGVPYLAYLIERREISPAQPGPLAIGAAAVDVNAAALTQVRKVHRQSQPLTVEVMPP